MTSLVFASTNRNKIGEILKMLPSQFKLLTLQDIMITGDIAETGSTIKENSFLKANYVANYLRSKNINFGAFADDSGLEVEALNGAPGVYSARYAGELKSVEANNKKLLDELKNAVSREARFVTVITLILNGEVHYFEGEIKGTIASEPKGTNGFGYDPLFVPEGHQNTFAELTPEEKNLISHRGRAVAKLIQFLKERKS